MRRAWAVWVLSTQSFASRLDGSFGYDKKKRTTTKKISNKREEFTENIALRMQDTLIECADAIYIIKSRDTADTFFYCDPPYYNANMGHYDGYTIEDFELLLKALSEIKGKFLLSSYQSDLLTEYTRRNKWKQKSIELNVSACGSDKGKKKVEVLTWNY